MRQIRLTRYTESLSQGDAGVGVRARWWVMEGIGEGKTCLERHRWGVQGLDRRLGASQFWISNNLVAAVEAPNTNPYLQHDIPNDPRLPLALTQPAFVPAHIWAVDIRCHESHNAWGSAGGSPQEEEAGEYADWDSASGFRDWRGDEPVR